MVAKNIKINQENDQNNMGSKREWKITKVENIISQNEFTITEADIKT
jgi:hypothetical protein